MAHVQADVFADEKSFAFFPFLLNQVGEYAVCVIQIIRLFLVDKFRRFKRYLDCAVHVAGIGSSVFIDSGMGAYQ